jgi:hypothetical protein
MGAVTQAFLFDADSDGVSAYYGGDFEPPFLRALSDADPRGVTQSTAYLGDIIIGTLCERVTAVSKKPRGSQYTMGHDNDLYRLIIWDLAEAFTEQWNTLDIESFPITLGRRNVYCITIESLLVEFRTEIDARLRPTSGYLGSVEVDLGNPIQKTLFLDQLIDVAVIAEGYVTMELSWEGSPETTFAGAEHFTPNGERRVAYGQLQQLKPSNPSVNLSNRGRISAERYEGKRRYTVYDRVLSALANFRFRDDEPASFSFESSQKDKTEVLEADLPEAKFVRYLLNPDHPDGRSKAKFFNDKLGISASDWRYLAAQFHAGLRQTDLTKLKVKEWKDGYGASFNCTIPILGINGQTGIVETNWILKPGRLPQLSTAFPAQRTSDIVIAKDRIQTVPSDLSGKAKWEAIYAVAHEARTAAAKKCVPTPMKIVGFDVIMEGSCGYAHIHIPDARRGFARWLVRSGKGSNHYRSGAVLYASVDSQSYDRAVAYAEAFATVLQLNGIKCSVEARLD